MKVTKVEALIVHPGWRKNLIFVRVATDAGIVGWGEAYSQYDRDRPITRERGGALFMAETNFIHLGAES